MSAETASRLRVDLRDKVALVTGAGRGIGQAIAFSLADAGATVACVDINKELLDGTVAGIESKGFRAKGWVCDVSDAAQVDRMVQDVLKTFSRIDILVNNAGITRDNLILRMKDDEWDAVLNVNLRGAFLMCRAVAKAMIRAHSGRIVNIASVSGMIGNPGQANYSASKAGLIGLTRTLARELAKRNITVNAVAPGFIGTEMSAKLGQEVIEEIKQRTPLGRLGDPQDVADAVLFLCSEAAGFITGHVLVVDGGLTA
ncbi:MAG: 3-oxoacyl-[acyl-carrier-protein] reductase [Thermoguttaceae bacterium]|nr:3-oxoacyl-[acyl-carrier-protein] reductase [Thermoguttaceae bacterium]MDW8077573.1 3-oxoacyl-[acyl-carrier-protein] reductase [Thermoguttaceae bacterium]